MKKNDVILAAFLVILALANIITAFYTSMVQKNQQKEFADRLVKMSANILRRESSRITVNAESLKDEHENTSQLNAEPGGLVPSRPGVQLDGADRFNYHRFVNAGIVSLDWNGDIFEEGDFIPSIGVVTKIYNTFVLLDTGKVVYNNQLSFEKNSFKPAQASANYLEVGDES